jgi:hypothetical protein
VKLILILPVVLFQIFFIDFFEVAEIVGTFRINAFMYDEVLAGFLRSKSMGTVRTPQL